MEPITGAIICGPKEADRYFEQTLQSITKVVDQLVVVLCNATGKEMELALKYKAKIRVDNRDWGLNQANIKSDVHKTLSGWVLCLDADEVVDEQVTKEFLRGYQDKGPKAYHFYLVNHWDETNKWRMDMSFWRVHYYNAVKEYGTKFESVGFDPGLVPHWAASHATYMPVFVRHFGLMKKEDRDRKVKRYEKYDPQQKRLPVDYYNALKSTAGAEEINLGWLRQELIKQTKDIPLRPYKHTMAIQKFHYIRRKKDGFPLDITDKEYQEKIANRTFDKEFEYISVVEIHSAVNILEVPVVDEEMPVTALAQQEGVAEPKTEPNPLLCILCGFIGADPKGLKRHKTRKHINV